MTFFTLRMEPDLDLAWDGREAHGGASADISQTVQTFGAGLSQGSQEEGHQSDRHLPDG